MIPSAGKRFNFEVNEITRNERKRTGWESERGMRFIAADTLGMLVSMPNEISLGVSNVQVKKTDIT